MSVVAVIGALCLGIIIGWLVRELVPRFKNVSVKVLSAVVSVVIGGVVLAFLSRASDDTTIWFYPIGLIVGFAARRYNFLRNKR